MARPRPTWILTPDATVPPNGPLQLGTVLSSPTDIHSVIGRGPKPSDTQVLTTTRTNVQHLESGQSGTDTNIVSTFLHSILGTDISRKGQETVAITFDSLHTTELSPSASMEYIYACSQNEKVKSWVQAHVFRRRLYVVTGLKVAHGVKIKNERSEDPGPGLAEGVVEVGPSVSLLESPLGTTAIQGLSSATFSNDCVVAYRLRLVMFSRGKKENVKGFVLHPTSVTSTADTSAGGGSVSVGGDTSQSAQNNEAGAGGGEPVQTPTRTSLVPGEGEDKEHVQIGEEDVDSEELDRPRRILSLDGGGVRGISSLLLLKDVMDAVKREEQHRRASDEGISSPDGNTDGTRKASKEIYPCEYFDLICGTSTGGLIAIMLGRLGMTVDDCIEKYTTMAGEIFGSKSPKPDVLYDAKILQACVEDAIADAKLPKDAKLDSRDAPRGCKTFVVATATLGNGAEPFLLRSYSADSQIPSPFDCTIVEACRATSAAPSFFDPMVINGTTFGEKSLWGAAQATSAAPTFFGPMVMKDNATTGETELGYSGPRPTKGSSDREKENRLALSDGGLTANNPTFEALLEAALRIPGWGRRLAAVVSIGTGTGTPPRLTRSPGFIYKVLSWVSQRQALRLDIAKYCADLVTDTEATHARVVQSLDVFNIKYAYFRLNAKDVGKFELDDVGNMPVMEEWTEKHIRESAEQRDAREKLPLFLCDPDYTRDHFMNERHGIPGVIPTAEASIASSLPLQVMARSKQSQDETPQRMTSHTIPWTWHVRYDGKPAMHSLIFYNYDEKTKSTWDHNGHIRRDQSVLTDRRDEGESAIAVLELMSDFSFVSSKFVQRWKIKVHDVPPILKAKKIMINGLEVRCDKFIWLSFRCAGFGMKTQRTWFRVLKADDVEVVFGKEAFDRNARSLN